MWTSTKTNSSRVSLLTQTPCPIATFTTKNSKRTEAFRNSVARLWVQRNITSKVSTLSSISHLPPNHLRNPRLEEMWNKVDKEIGWIFAYAEKALKVPKFKTDWSPTLAHVGSICRYWRTRLSLIKSGNPINQKLRRTKTILKIQDDLTNDVISIETCFAKAQQSYQALRYKDKEARREHLETLYSQYSTPLAKNKRKAVAAICGSELQQKMFRNIKRTLRPMQSTSVSRVDIPIDMVPYVENDEAQDLCINTKSDSLKTILQRTIQRKRTQGPEKWVTLTDQVPLEKAILMYNHQHFQQSKNTPFGSGNLASLVGSSGLTEASSSILDGSFKMPAGSSNSALNQFLVDLAIPHSLREAEEINTELTIEEYTKAILKWRESTSTSPSGRHLGIYRATVNLGNVTTDMCKLLNIVSRVGLVPDRWTTAISALIEKDPGQPNITPSEDNTLVRGRLQFVFEDNMGSAFSQERGRIQPIWEFPTWVKTGTHRQ